MQDELNLTDNSNKKIAIVICVHHKPWLVMSLLVSLTAQDYYPLDLFFIYQIGDGSCLEKTTYNEYRSLANKYGLHPFLSEYDPRVKDVCKINGYKIKELELENDQALDSGAWYKFIKTGFWKNYDYVFFLQEGTILTRPTVISSALKFTMKNKVHFLSAGHEKQCLTKELLLNWNTREPHSEMDIFHDRMIEETFKIFQRDNEFDTYFQKWSSGFPIETQNHVPDLGKEYWLEINLRNKIYENIYRCGRNKIVSSKFYKSIILALYSLRDTYERFSFVQGMNNNLKQPKVENPRIVVNTRIRQLKELVDFYELDGVKFHMANDDKLQWFGCSCQHLFSNELLESFSRKLERFSMYDVLDLPFAASALEVIWGFLPNWLGFDKWFFDGIHRVRKDFFTYEREDSPAGMARYLNWYYKGKIIVEAAGDFIRIKRTCKDLECLKERLNSFYF